jgi:hypothetical protein
MRELFAYRDGDFSFLRDVAKEAPAAAAAAVEREAPPAGDGDIRAVRAQRGMRLPETDSQETEVRRKTEDRNPQPEDRNPQP